MSFFAPQQNIFIVTKKLRIPVNTYSSIQKIPPHPLLFEYYRVPLDLRMLDRAAEGGEVVWGFGVCVEGDSGEAAFHSRKGES